MPAAHRSNGRVTPKGVRPTGVTPRNSNGQHPDTTLGRNIARTARPLPDRRGATRPTVTRTGHRGGR